MGVREHGRTRREVERAFEEGRPRDRDKKKAIPQNKVKKWNFFRNQKKTNATGKKREAQSGYSWAHREPIRKKE
jgi:hypothetical protein